MSQQTCYTPRRLSVVVKPALYRRFLGILLVYVVGSALVSADTRINILNAEDMALLDGGEWVFASSMHGGLQSEGGIYAIGVHSGRKHRVYLPDSDTSSMAQCPAPVPAKAFAPHGIALHRTANGDTRLYVVNHGSRESIEIFAVAQQHSPTLRWLGCILLPPGAFGNTVAVVDNGTVFMTNMGKPIDGSAPLSPLGGDVLSWTATKGWRTVPDSAIIGPNGLLVSPDGHSRNRHRRGGVGWQRTR